MIILKKEIYGGYKLKEIPNTLEAMQAEVDGYIETVAAPGNCVIVCNEEGRIKGLPYNTTLENIPFYGPLFICGEKDDEFCDVPQVLKDMFGGVK